MPGTNSSGKTHKLQKSGGIKKIAGIMFLLLLIMIASNLISVYQTRQQLTSPLIPASTIHAINKEWILRSVFLTVVGLIGFMLYYNRKYIPAIIIISLGIVVSKYLYTSMLHQLF